MLFRQLFDSESSTYSYLLADAGQAVLIDPVKNKLDDYLRLLRELDLQLVLALDTHTHADHITALGELRSATGCRSGFGQQSGSACASFTFADGQRLAVALFAATRPLHQLRDQRPLRQILPETHRQIVLQHVAVQARRVEGALVVGQPQLLAPIIRRLRPLLPLRWTAQFVA